MSDSQPGDILIYDYRSNPKKLTKETKPLKVTQWNIERGYKLKEIIKELKLIDPDIAIIQEVDIGCLRSGKVDQMLELCKAMGWLGGFVTEFIELESPLRSDRDQGGGVHGNAIFSKFDMKFDKIDHFYQPIDWNLEGNRLKEPRVGRRMTLVAQVSTPSFPILCYSAHLEVFCGLSHRVQQFSEILHHSHLNSTELPYQLVFGDMNTMGHSLARFSTRFCKDSFRWRSIGLSESSWWGQNLLTWHVNDGPINIHLAQAAPELLDHPKVLEMARNPGLFDPWDLDKDITLDNPNFFGLYKAKLDWTLVRGFDIIDQYKSNLDYSASDHLSLNLTIMFDPDPTWLNDPFLFKARCPRPKLPKNNSRLALLTTAGIALFSLILLRTIKV